LALFVKLGFLSIFSDYGTNIQTAHFPPKLIQLKMKKQKFLR